MTESEHAGQRLATWIFCAAYLSATYGPSSPEPYVPEAVRHHWEAMRGGRALTRSAAYPTAHSSEWQGTLAPLLFFNKILAHAGMQESVEPDMHAAPDDPLDEEKTKQGEARVRSRSILAKMPKVHAHACARGKSERRGGAARPIMPRVGKSRS